MPTIPGWPVEGGKDLHPVTRTSQEHVDFREQPAVDFAKAGTFRGTHLGDWTVAQFAGVVTCARYVGGQYGPGWIVEYEGEVEGIGTVRIGLCHHGTDEDGGLLVAEGDFVEEGQRLGPVGYSGWTIPPGIGGVHLHLKMYVNGERVDPEPYLT